MGTKKSKVNPSYKKKYRVSNWAEYNSSLVRRGEIEVWLSETAIAAWTPLPSGRPGGQQRFSEVAIETALTLRMVFGLPLRQTEGFLNSILRFMAPQLRSPNYSTLSRRAPMLDVRIPARPPHHPVHLIIDATGLKVFGRGEWSQAKHGRGSTGTGWRKFHLAVDESGTILAAELTEAEVADAAIAPDLLESAGGDLRRLTTDGGYDRRNVYEAAEARGADIVIPPRKDAVVSSDPCFRQRNEHQIHRKRVGKRMWRVETGQHRQARVENSFHRYKSTFGRSLRARTESGQRVEVMLGCRVLNRMFELGRPKSRTQGV